MRKGVPNLDRETEKNRVTAIYSNPGGHGESRSSVGNATMVFQRDPAR